VSGLEKIYGKGVIMNLEGGAITPINTISTGSIGIDKATGVGGFPRGRIIEVYGPESSGKTTLGLHVIAEAQKRGGICAFVDAEHALDIKYAKDLGVKIGNKDLFISQPSNGEEALEVVDELVGSHAIDVIVVDSVASLVPQAEIDGNMGDAQMALQARLMSQALRKLAGIVERSKTILIFINQLRMKIGVFFGSPETTTGGNALKFYASMRIDIRKIETLTKGGTKGKDGKTTGGKVIGSRTKIKIVKNKVAPPFKDAIVVIRFGEGISRMDELLILGEQYGVVEKSGSWYAYGDERIGQGQDNARLFLKDNKHIAKDIEKKIREKIKEEDKSAKKV